MKENDIHCAGKIAFISSVVEHFGKGRHVAVLHGGFSKEREISNISSRYVVPRLVSLGYRVSAIDIGMDIAEVLLKLQPDVVFNCLHGTYGEDGCIAGILNLLNIPYTHSGVKASNICFYKDVTKRICKASDILCPKWELIHNDSNVHPTIPLPYVIKPLAQGSSLGVEIMFPGDGRTAKDYDFAYGNLALLEEYIKGREIHVALLHGKALGMLEIKYLKNRFFDYESKYTPGFAEHILDPQMPLTKREEILRIAEKAYSVLSCRGIARADFIYEPETGNVYLLEINTHPGFTELSLCPEIALKAGISFSELLERILAGAQCD